MGENDEKKIKEVAALKYSPEDNKSPEIIALGKGETADRIIETAKENNIPIVENASLAHTLNKLRIGDEIPPDLYEIVAEILVFVSSMDKSFGARYDKK